ncbi:hypothetical protein H6G89_08660 [Oscillatoria sp. FACHB-1407]|uniref:hypothetical protein n=1 Tax=Oscillatoria sp. FACHB-1407 TaxID=2692847 RepID=UPI0016876EE9|nr:hypothetical protein [Oscillatoria sp. FACHB-1407]MBD2461112.1 hypothetical protein [Oscillatoria sp. FACHB-1407]
MDIQQQIKTLIDNAPQDGTTPAAIEAIAPALKLIAEQLKHPEYYILQTLEQNWVMTTLSHRTQPDVSKNVIYAFPTLKDATAAPYAKDPQVISIPVPVIHILFQMVAMQTVDSIVFFENSGNTSAGTEVTRQDLQNLIQVHLQKMQGTQSVPPNIA